MPPQVASSGATGIRGAYETLGVQAFYEAHGHEYSNPHSQQIVKAIALLMSSHEFAEQPGGSIRVLDLACGAGEATLALRAWAEGEAEQQQQHGPQQQGPQQQGQQQGQQQTRRPPGRRRGQPQPAAADSAACWRLDIVACDPFTQEAYRRQAGGQVHDWSFQDIADGCLAGRSFDLCVCSFALHLCDPSCLFITLFQLSSRCRWLAVLAPHKQPHVREEHGWAAAPALKVDRVHVRLYQSLNWGQQPQE